MATIHKFAAKEVKTAGGVGDVDSLHVGDCARLPPECDVRSAQTVTISDVPDAASIVHRMHQASL